MVSTTVSDEVGKVDLEVQRNLFHLHITAVPPQPCRPSRAVPPQPDPPERQAVPTAVALCLCRFVLSSGGEDGNRYGAASGSHPRGAYQPSLVGTLPQPKASRTLTVMTPAGGDHAMKTAASWGNKPPGRGSRAHTRKHPLPRVRDRGKDSVVWGVLSLNLKIHVFLSPGPFATPQSDSV